MSKESEMFQLISLWEESGKDRQSFCAEHGIKVSKFSYWRTRYKERHAASGTNNFVALEPSSSSSLELIYPNGVRIAVPSGTDHSMIASLISLV